MTRSDPLERAVRPFRRRLSLYAALNALLYALAAGGFLFCAATLFFRVRQTDAGPLPLMIAAGAAVLAWTTAFLVLRPDYPEAAREIDAAGLKERASTMLALRRDPSEIAALQRSDALLRLGGARAGQLKPRFSRLAAVLALIALLLAALSVLAPDAWFVRAGDETAKDEVLEMLREERDRLREMGEERLAGEFDELIGDLEGTDSLLRSLGEIEEAEEGVRDAAREGEASRSAMREALDTLEEARRALLGEEETEEAAGEDGEGEPGEGEETLPMPGEGEFGMEGSGEMPGEMPGEIPGEDGNGPGRGEGEGEARASNMTEPVYDPISGSVPYGDVFSAYYSEYLRKAESGGIPYGIAEAADAYFRSLDR